MDQHVDEAESRRKILQEVGKFSTHTRKNRLSMARVNARLHCFLTEYNSEFPSKFSYGMIKNKGFFSHKKFLSIKRSNLKKRKMYITFMGL